MRRAITLLLIAAGLALPASCPAYDDAPVARPEIKSGDRWTYHRVDARTGTVLYEFETRVALVGGDSIRTVSVLAGRKQESESFWTLEWNSLATSYGVFSPHSGMFRFPLAAGATYRSGYQLQLPKSGGAGRIDFEHVVKVVGWEYVVVPAGAFRALKVEMAGQFSRRDYASSGSTRTVAWYVPAVKRWVMLAYENPDSRSSAINQWRDELLEFKVE